MAAAQATCRRCGLSLPYHPDGPIRALVVHWQAVHGGIPAPIVHEGEEPSADYRVVPTPNRILSPDAVRAMRLLRERGLLYREVAAVFGCAPETARQACKGRTWASVK